MAPYKILSLDGGGIRGIIPAMLLAHVEKVTDRPIHELFDLIAGTSTGGILALALTRDITSDGGPRPAEQLVDLYGEEGGRIFKQNFWRRLPGAGAFEEKYPHDGVEDVAREYLGDTMLSEARTEILVTAYELEGRTPFFFRSRKAKTDPAFNYPMWRVARATSAAPTFFEPHKLEDGVDPAKYYSLVDGGVFANNPAMCALAEALGLGESLDDVIMLSLGTGQHTRPIRHDDARAWGLAKWAVPITSVMMDGVSDTVAYQVGQVVPTERYLRIQAELTDAMDDMDDASRANIEALKRFATRLTEERAADLEAFAERLSAG